MILGPDVKGAASPLGTLKSVRETLAGYNTASDGSGKESMGLERLYGPGMVVEVPTSQDPVNQAVASLNDDDLAMPVLFRVCKAKGWRLMDVESGRMFGG